MSEETKVEVSAEMEKFISYIENMTVLDLSKLVKALEERLGRQRCRSGGCCRCCRSGCRRCRC